MGLHIENYVRIRGMRMILAALRSGPAEGDAIPDDRVIDDWRRM
jgi:hypothetical protein